MAGHLAPAQLEAADGLRSHCEQSLSPSGGLSPARLPPISWPFGVMVGSGMTVSSCFQPPAQRPFWRVFGEATQARRRLQPMGGSPGGAGPPLPCHRAYPPQGPAGRWGSVFAGLCSPVRSVAAGTQQMYRVWGAPRPRPLAGCLCYVLTLGVLAPDLARCFLRLPAPEEVPSIAPRRCLWFKLRSENVGSGPGMSPVWPMPAE